MAAISGHLLIAILLLVQWGFSTNVTEKQTQTLGKSEHDIEQEKRRERERGPSRHSKPRQEPYGFRKLPYRGAYDAESRIPTPCFYSEKQSEQLEPALDRFFAHLFANAIWPQGGEQVDKAVPKRPARRDELPQTVTFRPPTIKNYMPFCSELGFAFTTYSMATKPRHEEDRQANLAFYGLPTRRFLNGYQMDVRACEERVPMEAYQPDSSSDDEQEGFFNVPPNLPQRQYKYFPPRHVSTEFDFNTNCARDSDGGPNVVIRKIFHDFSRMMQEASMLRLVHHENLERGICMEIHNGHPAIVREYLGGVESGEAIYRMAYDAYGYEDYSARMANLFLTIIAKCLSAIFELHDMGFVHGDIKPFNIILDYGGNPVIIDLDSTRIENLATWHRTSPGFAAPECRELVRGPVGKAVDFWSFGVTVLEWVYAMRAAEADRALQLKHYFATKEWIDFTTFRNKLHAFTPFNWVLFADKGEIERFPFQIPGQLAKVVWYLLQPDPMRRSYDTVEKRAEFIKEALGDSVDMDDIRREARKSRVTPIQAHLDLVKNVPVRFDTPVDEPAMLRLTKESVYAKEASIEQEETGYARLAYCVQKYLLTTRTWYDAARAFDPKHMLANRYSTRLSEAWKSICAYMSGPSYLSDQKRAMLLMSPVMNWRRQ